MAERSLFSKLFNPTEEEKEEIIKGVKEGQKYLNILSEEGFSGFVTRVAEEELLDQGVSEKEIRQRSKEAEEFRKKSLMPKIGDFFVSPTDKKKTKVRAVERGDKEIEIVEEPRSVGIPADEFNEISTSQSIGSAIQSGLIKIPKGVVNFGTLIYDALQGEGIDVDRSATQKFNDRFENTFLGIMEKQSEEAARQTAAGRILEALTQLYGAGTIAAKTTVPATTFLATKADELAGVLAKSIKNKKYTKTLGNDNLRKAGEKAAELNKGSTWPKWVGVAVGGGVGAGALVAKVEDIGTFGDFIDFIPTELDREEKDDAAEDALRQLNNKFLFAAEYAFPIIPFVYGLGKAGKLIATKGKDLAFSNSRIERWIDKFAQQFRSRSSKHQKLFEGVQQLEGNKSAGKMMADDFAKDIDDALKLISKDTRAAGKGVEPDAISKMMANFLTKTQDAVVDGQIFFNGFNPKVLSDFTESLKKLGVSDTTINKVIDNGVKFRTTTADLKNAILQGGNINAGAKEFNDIMFDRVNNFLSSDYKLIDLNKGLFDGYIPTREAIDEVIQVIQRYGKANGVNIGPGKAEDIVNNIIKNMEVNPINKQPSFPLGTVNILDDQSVIIKNIGENITAGGKFKPDKTGGLIQTKSDLQAFKNLFGEYQNAKKLIYNTMGDLANIRARDRFYNFLKQSSDAEIKAGGRGIFRGSYDEARQAFPNKEIIKDPRGLKLQTRLSDELYTSPLDGLYTTREWADAIKLGDDLVSSGLTKSAAYRYLVLLPKGLTQVGKTVLGPLTQMRNFSSSFLTTIHSGNIFIDPRKILEFHKKSLQTIQPQVLYKLTGNPRFRNTPAGQQLYKYLLESGVVNQSTTFRDIEGVLQDIQKYSGAGVDNFMRKVFESFTKPFKKTFGIAQDAYVAGDDWFRVYNFLAEAHKLEEAFKAAKNKGLIKEVPNTLQIWDEAAAVVRETVPNYAYVSDFVKGVRRSPLGNFGSFPAEIYRTAANSTARSIKEIKDPVRSSIGYRRMTGQAITYAAVPTVAYEGVRGMYGISREVAEAIREFVPSWSRDNTLLPVYENGKYKYIDFSHGFFYDTVVNPIQSVLAEVDAKDEKPLIEGVAKGFVNAIGNALQPFVSESIYVGAMTDIFIRGGYDKEGNKVFNQRDTLGDKIYKSMKHVTYALSPGNFPALKRLYKSATNKTQYGTRYEIPDELMGFFGARKIPLDVPRTLNFYIGDFLDATDQERGMIYEGTLTGDPVEDENRIIEQYIKAMNLRLESFNKLKRQMDAAKVLGMRDREIFEQFDARGRKNIYAYLDKNKFLPLGVTGGMQDAYRRLSKQYGIDNPLTKRIQKTINKIQKRLYKQRLNQDFIIDPNDYIIQKSAEVGKQSMSLPEQPMPSSQVIQSAMMPTTGPMNQGLTPTENALLSEEEKMIRLRSRGLA